MFSKTSTWVLVYVHVEQIEAQQMGSDRAQNEATCLGDCVYFFGFVIGFQCVVLGVLIIPKWQL